MNLDIYTDISYYPNSIEKKKKFGCGVLVIDKHENEYILHRKFDINIIRKHFGSKNKRGGYVSSTHFETYLIYYVISSLFRSLQHSDKKYTIRIYTDSLGCFEAWSLKKSNKKRYFSSMINTILKIINNLEKIGHSVDIRWVPGHSDVYGNEKADSLSRYNGDEVYENDIYGLFKNIF